LKTNGFQGFDGGDKRDRTADLLNAILKLSTAFAALRQRRITMKKSRKSINLPAFFVSLLYHTMTQIARNIRRFSREKRTKLCTFLLPVRCSVRFLCAAFWTEKGAGLLPLLGGY